MSRSPELQSRVQRNADLADWNHGRCRCDADRELGAPLLEEVDAVMIGRNSVHRHAPTRLIVPGGSGGAGACEA